MHITVLSPHLKNPWSNLGDMYIALGIARLLQGHSITWLALQERPSPATLKQVQTSGALVIGGSNIIGAMGSVRMGWRKEDFEALNIPVIPLAIGSQAPIGGKPVIDEYGLELLDAIVRKSGLFSVRDQMTEAFMKERYGESKIRLTGCSAIFAGAGARERTQDIVYCAGLLFPYVSHSKNTRYWEAMRYMADTMHVTHVTGQQQESAYFDKFLGKPVELFGNDYMAALSRLESGRLLISGRIHAALAAAQRGMPTAVIATDERCVSMAKTHAIPCVQWSPALTKEAFVQELQSATQLYNQGKVDATFAHLRSNMQLFLQSYGISFIAPNSAVPVIPIEPFIPHKHTKLLSYGVACSRHFHWLYPLLHTLYSMLPKRK